jgi:hypothetical protein
MAVALTDAQAQDFLSRHPIDVSQVGRYGIIVRDESTWVDVYVKGSYLGFLNVTSQAGDLGVDDMADGEIRQVVPKSGAVQEVGIMDILRNLPDNIVFDPSLIESGAQDAAEFINAIARETGKDLGAITSGVSQGLFNISLFGIPLPVIALFAGAAYVGLLLLQSGLLKKT